jgi:hypothetical protein
MIQGFAWSGNGSIKVVDVTTDCGRNWREATLEGPVFDKCLTRFRFPWKWTGAPASIASRAVDSTGYVQPTVEDIKKVRAITGFNLKGLGYRKSPKSAPKCRTSGRRLGGARFWRWISAACERPVCFPRGKGCQTHCAWLGQCCHTR